MISFEDLKLAVQSLKKRFPGKEFTEQDYLLEAIRLKEKEEEKK